MVLDRFDGHLVQDASCFTRIADTHPRRATRSEHGSASRGMGYIQWYLSPNPHGYARPEWISRKKKDRPNLALMTREPQNLQTRVVVDRNAAATGRPHRP